MDDYDMTRRGLAERAMETRWEYIADFPGPTIICFDEKRERIGSGVSLEIMRHICDMHNEWLAKQSPEVPAESL